MGGYQAHNFISDSNPNNPVVIISTPTPHKSKDRQYNGWKKIWQTMIYKTLYRNLEIVPYETH